MEILRLISEIRNPVLDKFFGIVTYLGSGVVALTIIMILYWCLDKKLGYRLGFAMIVAGMTAQILKLAFRIPRPWVLDPKFKPVKSAVKGATGYSFPSGHSTQVTATAGGIAGYILGENNPFKNAVKTKRDRLKVVLISAIIVGLVVFSRMYLGVHTPLDVSVAVIISSIVAIITDKLFSRYIEKKDNGYIVAVILIIILGIIGAVYDLYMYNHKITTYADSKDAIKMAGVAIGLSLGWFVEKKYVNFKEKGIGLKLQIIKVVLGVATTFGLRILLKTIANNLFKGMFAWHMIRYAILVFWVVGIYPVFIKKFFSPKEEEQ